MCSVHVFRKYFSERESSVTQLCDELSTLQIHTGNIRAAVPARADACVPTAGPAQELERSLLSAEKDLCAVQGGRRTVMAKKLHLLDVRKSPEGQAEVLGAKLCGAQTELANITLQFDAGRGHVNTIAAERDGAAVCHATVKRDLRAVEVTCDAPSRSFTTVRRPVSRMEAALINLHTEVDDCLGVSSFCCSTILSAIDSRLGIFMSTLYEAVVRT